MEEKSGPNAVNISAPPENGDHVVTLSDSIEGLENPAEKKVGNLYTSTTIIRITSVIEGLK